MATFTLPSRVVDYCIVVGPQLVGRQAATQPSSPNLQPSNAKPSTASLPTTPSAAASSASTTANTATPPTATIQQQQLQPGQLQRSTGTHPRLQPVTLQRFPARDHSDAEAPLDIAMFAFPQLTYELADHKDEREVFSCVLTEANGSRVYVSCMRWWERADDSIVRAVQGSLDRSGRRTTIGKIDENGTLLTQSTMTLSSQHNTYYAPKCILLTSHWPFFTQMENYLTALYQYILPSSPVLPYPIERSLQNLIYETPLPPPGQLAVECRPLPGLVLNWIRPPPNGLPMRDFSLLYLFRLLSPDNVIALFAAATVEKRILFISSHLHRLTLSAECLLHLLFPFLWRNIYIPILPQQLLEFTCAPMPFIMGCPTAYRPDNELLEGVLVVDLDANTVVWNGNNDEKPSTLPYQRLVLMQKALKRLFMDTTVPLRTGVAVSEDEVSGVFIRFFARVLATYRDYLTTEHTGGGSGSGHYGDNAASIDKFDRLGWLERNDDKSSNWITELLDTQMFQSFIDDRSEETREQLDVLVFDEWIDREAGRPTPFLSDTSHDHQPHKRFATPQPYADDLDTNLFHYRTFPLLDAELMCVTRVPPRLSQPHTSNQHATPATVSMKFFTEKRLYSQYFHSLRLRSSKQDMVMKDIVGWSRESARVEEERCIRLDELCRVVLKESVETDTSVDAAWWSVRHFLSEQLAMEADMFAHDREDCFIPLSTTVSGCEHQLRLLFSEASVLEAKAAKLKAAFERSKAKAKTLEQKFTQTKSSLISTATPTSTATTTAATPSPFTNSSTTVTLNGVTLNGGTPATPTLGSASLLPLASLNSLITLRSEAEEALLETDEEEETFAATVKQYEERMPEIVDAIKTLNRERLDTYKATMRRWCTGRREWLQGMLENLSEVEGVVEGMDVERDMRRLTEGAADFNRLMQIAGGSATATTTTVSGPAGAAGAAGATGLERAKEKVSATPSTQPMSNGSVTKRESSHDRSHSVGEGVLLGGDERNPLSRPLTPTHADGDAINSGDVSPQPKPSLTITTTSPPNEKGREESSKVSTTHTTNSSINTTTTHPGTTTSTISTPSLLSARKKGSFLLSRIEVPSPVSAPQQPNRPRAHSAASHSQPSSPAAGMQHQPTHHPTFSTGSSIFASLRSGSSPRLHGTLSTSSSLTSIASAAGHSPHPSTPSPSLATTFLTQIRKQHALDTLHDQQRSTRRHNETTQWKQLTLHSLNELTPSYPLNLWGEAGFEVACQQCTANKRTLKEMTMELEAWSAVMETKKKRWEGIVLLLPRLAAVGSSQARVWDVLKGRVALHARAYADYLSTVYRCTTELKLEKGELKAAVQRYQAHKVRLDKELVAAADVVSRAAVKRSKAAAALQAVEQQQKSLEQQPMNQKQLEVNAAAVERAIRDVKEADHEWNVSERDRVAIQRKHDGCLARMLLLMERKDTNTGLSIKRALNVLADMYQLQYVGALRRGDDELAATVRAVDINRDLTELVQSSYDAFTPPTAKIKPGEAADLSRHLRLLGSNAFSFVDAHILRSLDALRLLMDLLAQLADTEEADSKALKRCITPVRSCTNTSVQLALTSFDVWLERLVEVEEEEAKRLRDVTNVLARLKTSMKTTEKAKEKQYTDLERNWKRVQDERDRAMMDEKKADDAFQLTKARVDKAQAEQSATASNPAAAPTRQGVFSSLYTSSVDSLRHKQQTAEVELQKAKNHTAQRTKAMEDEHVKHDKDMAGILSELQLLEQSKWTQLQSFYSTLLQQHKLHLDRCVTHCQSFRQQVRQMDVHLDLMDFLAKHNSRTAPPLVVIEGELKRKADAEREEREKEEERARKEREEAERSQTFRSKRSLNKPKSPTSQSRNVRAVAPAEEAQMVDSKPVVSVPAAVQQSTTAGAEHSKPAAAVDGHVMAVDAKRDGSNLQPPADLSPTSTTASHSQTDSTTKSTSPSSVTSAGQFPPPRPPRPNRPRASSGATSVDLTGSHSSAVLAAASAAAADHPTSPPQPPQRPAMHLTFPIKSSTDAAGPPGGAHTSHSTHTEGEVATALPVTAVHPPAQQSVDNVPAANTVQSLDAAASTVPHAEPVLTTERIPVPAASAANLPAGAVFFQEIRPS